MRTILYGGYTGSREIENNKFISKKGGEKERAKRERHWQTMCACMYLLEKGRERERNLLIFFKGHKKRAQSEVIDALGW